MRNGCGQSDRLRSTCDGREVSDEPLTLVSRSSSTEPMALLEDQTAEEVRAFVAGRLTARNRRDLRGVHR